LIDQYILGVDAGGTFTDFVLLKAHQNSNSITVHKVLSTPEAPDRAIMQGIEELGLGTLLSDGRLQIVHGSTVATNACLEGKGAKTLYVTNRGFADLLTLARQVRGQLYALELPPVGSPVPSQYCIEVGGRIGADGQLIEPLEEADLERVRQAVLQLQPEAVAINLLFSFIDNSFERQIEAAIQQLNQPVFISRSSAVLPEYKEYERGIATWLNASLGPVVGSYLQRLEQQTSPCPLTIMQSSGETVSATSAAGLAVNLLLSGPAGGLAALKHLAEQLDEPRLISFDMGGTSTDVALLDGDLRITNTGRVANYPVAVPMVDMHTIGAGGGSVAVLDPGGMLHVGPRSAGASPGPACYGRGGMEPTVTDANVVLGRIHPESALAGSFKLHPDLAQTAVAQLAQQAQMNTRTMAEGIVKVTNEHMANALRVISVQRGYDPAGFTLVCFGGAGGLHVCALAEAMGMHRAIVPLHAGVFSAAGMLVAPRGRQFSRTIQLRESGIDDSTVNARLAELIRLGTEELLDEGLLARELQSNASVDMRYVGQSSSLNVPWSDKSAVLAAFRLLHQERYGFALDREVEFINLRVRLQAPAPVASFLGQENSQSFSPDKTAIETDDDTMIVLPRNALNIDMLIKGPAIVTEASATTYIASGWQLRVDDLGNLRLQKQA